jgi:hypothetical protein
MMWSNPTRDGATDNPKVRFWQGFSVALTLALGVSVADSNLSLSAQPSQRQRFTELDVERINIIESDGTVKLVIANRQRAPDQVTDGQSRPRPEANKSAGITFFDDAGDEAGGLKVRGDRRAGASAGRHLLFDQHRGDQVVGLVSTESEKGRTAGLMVWDVPDLPLLEVMQRYGRVLAAAPGAERDKLAAEFEACCRGFGANRLFLGKSENREARLALADSRGRERLRLTVAATGEARIEFLDEQGRQTSVLPSPK